MQPHRLAKLIAHIERGEDAEILRVLHEQPDVGRDRSEDGDTLLHYACWQKRAALVEPLLSAGADPNARGGYGRAPLHCAVHEGRAESVPLVRALVAAGADPSLRDDNGFTAAQWASQEIFDEAALASVLEILERAAEGSTESARFTRPASPPAGARPQEVAAFTRAIEARAHTGVALGALIEAFASGRALDVEGATRVADKADLTCLRDAARVLEAIGATSWAAPVRAWLADGRSSPPVMEWIGRYYGDADGLAPAAASR